jgi:hypothetical protein
MHFTFGQSAEGKTANALTIKVLQKTPIYPAQMILTRIIYPKT